MGACMTPDSKQKEYIISKIRLLDLEINCPRYLYIGGAKCDRKTVFAEIRSRLGPPPCPHWGIEHSDGMEWVCSRPAPAPCVWTYEDVHNKWDTECGDAFQFEEGDIRDNNFKFCPYCGRKIQEHP